MSHTKLYLPQDGGAVGANHASIVLHWRNALRIWWREIDRWVLALIAALMLIGMAAVAAASPASANRLSTAAVRLDDLYFFYAHIKWQLVGLTVLIGASLLPKMLARRLGILLAGAMLFFLFLVPIIGVEVNGAQRWIKIGMRFQPSEFLKPGFAILMAWILSWRLRDQKLPVFYVTLGIMGMIAGLLMLQPNLGAAILFAGVWMVLVLLSGESYKRLLSIIGLGFGGLIAAYMFYDNARNRIDAFLFGGTAFDQVDLAAKTLLAGGWTGTGMWLGTRKMTLPEAHTDYIFSVVGETWGLLACILIVVLYAVLVLRVLLRLFDEEDVFTVLAGAGLITQIGGQAMINILVNLGLFPAKGMTLPLVSYGGSSTIAVCLTLGLLLAITRRNPFLKGETSGLFELLGKNEERTR